MSELRIAVMAILTILALLAARVGLSEPFEARWQNHPSAPEAATVAVLDLDGATFTGLVDCAPGSICTTLYEVPPGPYDARLRVAADGYELSPYSAVQHVVVEPDPPPPPPPPNACDELPLSVRADFNGDGSVTTLDFGYFLRAFWGE